MCSSLLVCHLVCAVNAHDEKCFLYIYSIKYLEDNRHQSRPGIMKNES